jgi:CheY-like chemotaxis protein
VTDVERPTGEGTSTASDVSEPPRESAEGGTALLAVEDSRLYMAVWRRLAARLGWSITLAAPGDDLFALLNRSSRPHDLVLLSLSPNDPRTADLVRRFRSLPDYRAVPLILATTGGESTTLRRLLAAGVDALAERSDPAHVETALVAFHTALGPPPRVGCIEDSRVAGRRILDLLSGHYRMHLEHHADPAEALAVHRRDPYDVVLLDWTFPGPLQGAAIVEALDAEGEPAILVLSDAEELRHLPPPTLLRIDAVLPKRAVGTLLPDALASRLRELRLRRLLRTRVLDLFEPPVRS